MIILAKVVPYGGNAVRYALEKEKAKMVKVNHMPEGIDPTAIWYMMKHHCELHQQDRTVGRKLERFMVTFVASPKKEESAGWSLDDWANYQNEVLRTLDSVGLKPKGMDKIVKTNFRNSMNVGGLHSDSRSGTLHLHIDCCRVDLDGNTNDVHDIHERAMRAAEIINMNHDWEQPQEIRNMRREDMAECCEETLRNMSQFNVDIYFNLLRNRGYEIKPRYDMQGKLVGYTIGKNATVIKASEVGRKFMVSKLEDTWKKLHPKSVQVNVKPVTPAVTPMTHPSKPTTQATPVIQPKVQPKPIESAKTCFCIDIDDEMYSVWIPDSVKDIFLDEIEVPEDNDTATVEDVGYVAMLLFVSYIDAATSISISCGGGGGSEPSSDWGKSDDEDEREYAKRCVRMAHSMCKPKPRQRGFHK